VLRASYDLAPDLRRCTAFAQACRRFFLDAALANSPKTCCPNLTPYSDLGCGADLPWRAGLATRVVSLSVHLVARSAPQGNALAFL